MSESADTMTDWEKFKEQTKHVQWEFISSHEGRDDD